MNLSDNLESKKDSSKTNNDDGDYGNDKCYIKTTEFQPSVWRFIIATQAIGSAIYDRILYHKVLKKFHVPYFLYLYSGFLISKNLLIVTFPSIYPKIDPKVTFDIASKRYIPAWFLMTLFREILLARDFKAM